MQNAGQRQKKEMGTADTRQLNTLFPNQDVTAEQVYNSLQHVMKADAQLSKYAI